jgi:hypothetical protein
MLGVVVTCVIFIIKLHHDEEKYVTQFGVVPQASAEAILGSIIGAGILMIFFPDCNG